MVAGKCPSGKCGKCECRKCCHPCFTCTLLLFCGLASLGAAGFAVFWRFRFTPIYTEVECRPGRPEMGIVDYEGGFHVDFDVRTSCLNPNPYPVTLRTARAARLVLGKKFLFEATISESMEETVIPAKKRATIRSNVKMQPTGLSWSALFFGLSPPDIPVYVETAVQMELGAFFLFKWFRTSQVTVKVCGFELQSYIGQNIRVGSMACADRLEDVHVPDVKSRDTYNGDAELYHFGISEDEFKRGSKIREICLWTPFGVCVGLGVLFLAFAACQFARLSPGIRGRKDVEAEDAGSLEAGEKIGAAEEDTQAQEGDERTADIELAEVASNRDKEAQGCGCLSTPLDKLAGAGA